MSVPVEQHLRGRGIALQLSTSAAAFRDQPDGTTAVELDNQATIAADLILMSAGVRPSVQIAKDAGIELGPHGGIKVDTHMQTNDPSVWAAGDGVETPNTVLGNLALAPLAGPANRQGRVAAENICGRNTEYKSTQGTSIVKVFEMVAGGTGATERQLQQAGIKYESVHVHPSGHAGYYPGTAMMHLKVIFEPKKGVILGAQTAGFDGIDKRLDVMAVAVRQKMTVFDLEQLELAYAPPFGSAKDPVNMAGFVASNVMRGDLKLWKAEDYPSNLEGARLIDVRTPDEFAIWHIPGAENVPLATIREASKDWDKAHPIRLYCAVGFRSYLADRALVQRGFKDVATLSGGTTTLKFFHELEPESAGPIAPMENYAERESLFAPAGGATGNIVDLDCTGLACPGPIMKMSAKMGDLAFGDELRVKVSDPGFALDAPAWAKNNGHTVVSLEPSGPGYEAVIRKGGAGALAVQQGVALDPTGPQKVSFVVFSGDLDRLIAAFIIANGALAMGKQVSMFFTFWGLNALRRDNPPARKKSLLHKMFTVMMPRGADHTTLSNMNMMGAGTAMIKGVMKANGVASLPELMKSAMDGGAYVVGCTMTMDLLGIAKTDLLDGIDFGGVATFLGEASESKTTLFI
jgi:peroxiredoxin family protein/rhodanese-related sulfurtransferase/TusA-related sulfurtransferase